MYPIQAVIHLSNFRDNLRSIKRHLAPHVKICAAIKADAYGHGSSEIARAAVDEQVDYLAVARTDEGVSLRESGIDTPILVLGLPIPDDIPLLIAHRLATLVADKTVIEMIETEAKKRGEKPELHIKVDTGMGRIGCTPEEAEPLARMIAQSNRLNLGGVCTHFPVADENDLSYTITQIERFQRAVDAMKEKGIDPGIVHAANSGAVLHCPESHFDMVRPGILLYGYYPSREQKRILSVAPVMELETNVTFLKKVPPDTPISYGLTYRTTKETVIATLPVGYGDGYSRLLSNKGEVLINGKRYPIAGRVCMDQTMVDIGLDSGIKLFDRAVLFGPDPRGPSAEELADAIGTISYEVITGINKRVPRIYR